MTKVLLLADVVAQVDFGGVYAKTGQRRLLQLDPSMAHFGRRVVHGVGDNYRAAAIRSGEGHQMLRMIAQPKRRQVQSHSFVSNSAAEIERQLTLMPLVARGRHGYRAWPIPPTIICRELGLPVTHRRPLQPVNGRLPCGSPIGDPGPLGMCEITTQNDLRTDPVGTR
jgi:hypothetical protein